MSLLAELWSGGTSPEISGKLLVPSENDTSLQPRIGKSYSEALSSSSGEHCCRMDAQGEVQKKNMLLSGAKRPRSPTESSCGRCFRRTHKTADCRHQVVCLRCSGVGHVAANCRAELRRSPKRNRVHVRTKRSSDRMEQSRAAPPVVHARSPPRPHPSLPW